jgi:hypothetical protein
MEDGSPVMPVRKGLLPLALEIWQAATGQTEHRTLSDAQDFVGAAAKAMGHRFTSSDVYPQAEELAKALGISKWKPLVIAEPKPREAASTVVSIPTRRWFILYTYHVIFIFARASGQDR